MPPTRRRPRQRLLLTRYITSTICIPWARLRGGVASDDTTPQPNQMLADRVAKLSEEKYAELSAVLGTPESVRKVLSAVVMMRGSSGTGMVSGEVGGGGSCHGNRLQVHQGREH